MKIGLRIPHFGDHCKHERIFGQAKALEEAGFNSIWVRDHLTFHPHPFEGQSNNMLEPFTTLAAIAALTERIQLGTSTVVTYRHPLVTSALFGTLAFIAKGRIIVGIGAGGTREPLDAVELPFERRGKIVEEMLEILKLTWSQDNVSFHGEFYNFDNVTINPRPPAGTPLYYGGLTNAAIRRAVKYCDGWLPSRVPFKILNRLLEYKQKMEEKYQKEKPILMNISVLASIDKDSAKAWERVGIERVVGNLARLIKKCKWEGISATEEELDGTLVVGSPQECVDQIAKYQKRGFREILLDFRTTYDRWEQSVELMATEVLPHFKGA